MSHQAQSNDANLLILGGKLAITQDKTVAQGWTT